MNFIEKSVTFHWEDGETTLDLGIIPLEKTWVDGKELLDQFKDGCLIECNRKYLQTQIILNEVECLVLAFDESLEFISKKPVTNSNAPFTLLISEPFIVLLPHDSELKDVNIECMEYEEDTYYEEEEFPEIFVIEFTDEIIKRMEETAIPYDDDEDEAEEFVRKTLNELDEE